jgi:hypothetical protein
MEETIIENGTGFLVKRKMCCWKEIQIILLGR